MLSKFASIIITIVITLIISGSQKYMSVRKNWYLGAVVPLLTIIVISVLYFIKDISISVKSVLPCVIIIILEIFLWIDGRRQIREMELRRMKAKDI